MDALPSAIADHRANTAHMCGAVGAAILAGGAAVGGLGPY